MTSNIFSGKSSSLMNGENVISTVITDMESVAKDGTFQKLYKKFI